ncbi:MAG: DUF1800 family protein [Verrucomicrobiae bacterium]|nr:DUF1800 family protein [Verrucomicrobiae bacterium]
MNRRLLCLFSGCLLTHVAAIGAEFDLDGNGLDDIWEDRYAASGLIATEDSDKDGEDNGAESRAGTNPLDRDSRLGAPGISFTTTGVTLTFPSQAGKRYRIRGGSTPDASTFAELDTAMGNDGDLVVTFDPKPVDTNFFQVTVEDVDSDSDGLWDWTELQLDGYDPAVPNSRNPTRNDRDTLIDQIQGNTGTVHIAAIESEMYEKGPGGAPTSGKVRISRVGGLAPIIVFYSVSGSGNPDHEPATSIDYTPSPNGVAILGPSQSSVDISITAVADTEPEFPNTVFFQIQPHADYLIGNGSAELTIYDATDDPANQTNFVALMSSERGAQTSATGYGWVRLNGKKDRALVTMQFGGLTSTQTAAHIHHSNLAGDGITIINGPVVESLPLGQFTDQVWNIHRTGAYSGQNLIDSLFRRNNQTPLYCNAHTMENPGGEIWGFFEESTGTTEFVAPDDPPAIEPLTGEDLKRDVSRFLTQATFGPTQAEIDALTADIENNHGGDRIAGFSAWIDAQFALDQTKFYDLTYFADEQEWDLTGTDRLNPGTDPQPRQSNRQSAFWHIACQAHDQLRQRAAFALSEVLVVSEMDALVASRHYGLAKYYDILADHTDGNYLTILRDVSKSPIMGQYLSSLKNSKAVLDGQGNVIIAPDENYAREIMQLFSIGLLFRHPDGSLVLNSRGLPIQTYDNDDITELARVFTGWSFSKKVGSLSQGYPTQNNTTFTYYGGPLYFQASWENPMKNFSAEHDTGAKNVLGTTIAGGQTGDQDLNSATNILFNHQNTGPFISRLLIQRLVTSNPSSGYIYRVSQAFDTHRGNTKQMKEVFRSILLDYEARSLTQIDNIGFGKQKEPLIRYVQLMRAYGAKSDLLLSELSSYGYPASQLNNFPANATMLRWTTHGHSWWNQSHLRSPTVFNWFLPDQQIGGAMQQAGLVAPEFSLTNEYQAMRWVNYAYVLCANTWQGARELPLQRDPASSGGRDDTNGELDNIRAFQYVDALEAKVQGYITGGDSERIAFEKLLDELDLLLCAGNLKARYGGQPAPNPRESILDQVTYVYNPGNLPSSTDRAVKDLLYLLSTSPEFIIQK